MPADVVIAGAGLAGACAALALAPTRRVVVLDGGEPGASHAAAGLVNPFMGRKAKRAWRASGALDALRDVTDRADAPGLWRQDGLLRPASSAAQADVFRQRRTEHPDRLGWLPPEASGERFPHVSAPHGALWVREGGHIDIPALVDALLAAAVRAGAEIRRQRLSEWDLAAAVARDPSQPPMLLCCLGAGSPALFPDLPLHGIKGQTIRLRTPEALDLPAVSGRTYIVPVAEREVVVGATFEHDWDTPRPTPEATASLLERASGVVPALADAVLVEARAGIRMTVPASARPGRLPLLGPVSKHISSVWAFTGLGAKGLLTAPLLAQHLPHWLDAPEALWPEISTLSLWRDDG